MKKFGEVILLLLLLPGKPALTRCRSPEKETFTCWWEPGSDGGLPTTYALYYRKENSEMVYECPDYHTAGKNSCFFNKNDTSIWVNYNITVVASNALGSTFSDPVDIDVVYIVKPNPPEKVAVTVMEDKGWPFLRVSWEPPHKADTRSGWITLIYELRVKLDGENEWEMHLAGQQKMFNIFSLRSGGRYLVQVRCKPDHGFWSEWSSASHIKVPDYFHRERSVWILITVFFAFIFLIVSWCIHINSHSLKHCILPPVPGPKIRGFDKQLLKNGKSEDIFSALVVSDFPPTSSSNYEDLLVEYLEVYIPEEQELILEESKDLHDGCLKPKGSTFDSDSGRGSCDSHTLLMDKCGEAKDDEQQTDRDGSQTGSEAQRQQAAWEQEALTYEALSDVNISSIGHKEAPAGLQLPTVQSTEYVEVHTVNEDDMVLLHPVPSGHSHGKGCLQMHQGEDYSKVNGVDKNNVLLLQRDVIEEQVDMCPCENQDMNGATESCCTSAVNGYVDTATMFPLPIH
uniref:Prolactin receptor n=1 Tax=Acanthochromis polyacanthus TaxID=80966 RepID=A0A3Q1FP46_9TELE